MSRAFLALLLVALPARAQLEVEEFSAPPPGPQVEVGGWAGGYFGLDTRFESAPEAPLAENVTELSGRARLFADAKLSPRARLFIEGKVFLRGVAQRGLERSKASFEPTLGEAFVDLYSSKLDLRLGNQVVAFGANAALAPQDLLNPRDLREGWFASELGAGKLPAFGARLAGELATISWALVYFPFFSPHRYSVFGQDEALYQPADQEPLVEVDPSIEDELQPHVLETKRPRALPWLGDLGLRANVNVSKVRVGLSWVWVNEKLPRVEVDPELWALLSSQQKGAANPALALSVQNRLAAGEQLFSGTYGRTHVFAAEASTLISEAQLDLDLGFSPAQSFVDARITPLDKPALSWVLGLSQAKDSPFFYALTYVGMAVFGLSSDELLLTLEPATARGAARTGFLHLLLGRVSYRTLSERLELSMQAGVDPIQGSFALWPQVAYLGFDKTRLWLGAELFEGPAWSPFGYFGRNDRVLLGAEVALF